MTAIPTSFYKCDEGGAGSFLDSVGAVNLTDNNSCGSAAGLIINARTLNGSTQYASSTDSQFATGTTTDWTWLGWVYYTSSISGTQFFVSRDNNTGRLWSFQIGYPTDKKVGATVFDSGGSNHDMDSGVTVALNTWVFIVLKFDHTAQKASLSTNGGAFVDSSTITTIQTATMANSPLNIGRRAYPGAESYMTGRVDALGFFSGYAFADADVTEWYNGGAGMQYPAAAATYAFPTVRGLVRDLFGRVPVVGGAP